jgi:hypothetical protein
MEAGYGQEFPQNNVMILNLRVVKKRLDLPASLYTLLQVISVTLFEKMPISQALQQKDNTNPQLTDSNQLVLFNF